MNKDEMLSVIMKTCTEFSCIKLDLKVCADLFQNAEIMSYEKGDVILRMGDPCLSLGYVFSGAVRGYYLDKNGNDITRNFYMEHTFFLDEGLVDYKESACTYEALEYCRIVLLPIHVLKAKIYDNNNLKNLYLKGLEQSIRYKIARENSFLIQSATERYIDFKRNYGDLEHRVKQSHIATYLGITAESLSRIRRQLREIDTEWSD